MVVSAAAVDECALPGGSRLQVLDVELSSGEVRQHLWVEGEERVGAGVLEALRRGDEAGRFRFEPAADVVFEPGPAGERAVAADQSNSSRVVGDRHVVKLYRRLWPGPHPEIELGRHLTVAGFAAVPAFEGAVTWDGRAVALVQRFVANAQDGWEWGAEAVASGAVDDLARLGALTAGLQDALAALGRELADERWRAEWLAAARGQLDQAVALADPESAALLRRYEQPLRRELDALASAAAPVWLTRVHGDYHIGQVLRSPGGLAVVDFEGEPTRPVFERALPASPMRDLAAMLRSFDHLARSVVRGGGVSEGDAEAWIEGARAAFLGGVGPVDPELLRAFEVEKEIYEFVYAARYLPEWAYAARGGLTWLMESA